MEASCVADVEMAAPHYGRISAARESRYIRNFEGGRLPPPTASSMCAVLERTAALQTLAAV
jgi:hypothetical protein